MARRGAAASGKRAAKLAETTATIRLVSSASMTKGLDRARPYHLVEKPCNWLACRPALMLKSTMMPIGA